MECPLLGGLFCFQASTIHNLFDKAITNTAILRQYSTLIYWNIKSIGLERIKIREGEQERGREKKEERLYSKHKEMVAFYYIHGCLLTEI